MSYAPRGYQQQFWDVFSPNLYDWKNAPIKRAMMVWHRRSGKDLTALNFVEKAMCMRSGVYYHFLPTYTQAKKVIWDGKDKEGETFLSNFNAQLFDGDPHQTELKIKYRPTTHAPSGSIYQLIGGDQIDTIVGTNPVGVIFSEFPLMNPKAWDLVRPILRENGGWAIFIFTPRGKNHAYELWEGVKDDPEWYRSHLSILDTRRDAPGEDGGPIMTPADVESEIRAGMSRELANQEFYCSFDGALEGAYYADQLNDAEQQGRINVIDWISSLPVDTAWDLGLDDETAIWFTQTLSPSRVHVIDYVADSNVSLEKWIESLRKFPYYYGRHYGPHDIEVRDYSTGQTRLQFAATKGVHFEAQPKLSVEDGIDAARRLIPICYFDKTRAAEGISSLRSYHRAVDEKLGTFKKIPVHNWASHGADAFRTRAVAWRGEIGQALAPSMGSAAWREPKGPRTDTSWKRDGGRRVEIDTDQNVDIEWGESWWGKKE
jgi:phage terminase large subunit